MTIIIPKRRREWKRRASSIQQITVKSGNGMQAPVAGRFAEQITGVSWRDMIEVLQQRFIAQKEIATQERERTNL